MRNGVETSKHKQFMLKEALKRWQEWGFETKPKLLRTFIDGQNHHTGLIQVNDRLLVLKVFAKSFDRSLFDHTMELERWASKHRLAPATVYANDKIQILEFIDDQGFDKNKLSALTKAISTLHSIKKTEHERFDLLAFANEYLTNADALTKQWHTQLLPILIEFLNDLTPWTFCHNDLVMENCLFAPDGNVNLIDWEFAQHHNPWFDLAAIVLYFDLSEAQSKLFLEAYKTGWSSKMSERIFISSQLSLLWTDLLWNMHKYGREYRIKNPSRFSKLVALAQQLNIVLSPNS